MVNSQNLAGHFQWSTDFNISMYRNKVLELGPGGDPIYSGNNVTMIGQPRLARLPPPRPRPVDLEALVQRVAALGVKLFSDTF